MYAIFSTVVRSYQLPNCRSTYGMIKSGLMFFSWINEIYETMKSIKKRLLNILKFTIFVDFVQENVIFLFNTF